MASESSASLYEIADDLRAIPVPSVSDSGLSGAGLRCDSHHTEPADTGNKLCVASRCLS